MPHPNLQAAAGLMNLGMNQLNMDFTDKRMLAQVRRQAPLAQYIADEVIPGLYDSKNDMNPQSAMAGVIRKGAEIGMSLPESVGLWNNINRGLSMSAEKAGFKNIKDYLDVQLKTEQLISKTPQAQLQKQALKKAVPALTGQLNTLKASLQAEGLDASDIENLADELGEAWGLEKGFWEANLAKTPEEAADRIAQKIMTDRPEVAENFGLDQLRNVVLAVLRNPRAPIGRAIGEFGGFSRQGQETAPPLSALKG